jgi:hypothetical protein
VTRGYAAAKPATTHGEKPACTLLLRVALLRVLRSSLLPSALWHLQLAMHPQLLLYPVLLLWVLLLQMGVLALAGVGGAGSGDTGKVVLVARGVSCIWGKLR